METERTGQIPSQTTGKAIELERAAVRFGAFQAVQPNDLKIAPGECFSFLGPSGCGKAPQLRLVSGCLDPTEGDVRIGGQSMLGVDPSVRPTALIFQSPALFPLVPIWENVAFGQERRGWTRAKRKARAEELLAIVALSEHAAKMPAQLSGGQRQRVAIARALAVLGGIRATNPKRLRQGDEGILFLRPEKLRLMSPGESDENAPWPRSPAATWRGPGPPSWSRRRAAR